MAVSQGASASSRAKAHEGSTTYSSASTAEMADEEQPIMMAGIGDIRRLARMKAEQEKRLSMLQTRIDRLANQERKVWKDVTRTQHLSLQAQEAQWRRQAQQGDRLRVEREHVAEEQFVRERAQSLRLSTLETKDAPRSLKFSENQAIGRQAREDSRQLMEALKDVKEQTLKSKAMKAEVQRQQTRQNRLRRELERTRREQAMQEANALKFAELQEELQNGTNELAAAEQEELSAVSRLQNSQNVRAEVVTQLQDIEARCLEESLGCEVGGIPLASMDVDQVTASSSSGGYTNGGGSSPRGSRSMYSSRSAPAFSRGSRSGPGRGGMSSPGSRGAGNGYPMPSPAGYPVQSHLAGMDMGLCQITEEHQEDDSPSPVAASKGA